MAAAGTSIIKVMLPISFEEQKARLKERLDRPDKHWKYNPGDIDERKLWPKYQEAYQIAIERTSTDAAPWYVVPADRKWYARIAVQHLLLDKLRSFALEWPKAEYDVEAEKKHDFLWRVRPELPEPGMIGVFDRSHYEAVLIHRVRSLSTPDEVEERYDIINDFEKEVAATGTAIVKVMLHISAEEQKERLMARLDDPAKHWKYNPGDIDERAYWPAYMEAYEIAIRRTTTDVAPWHVVPADHKWYARLAVQQLMLDALRGLKLEWPKADYDVEAEKKRLAASVVE